MSGMYEQDVYDLPLIWTGYLCLILESITSLLFLALSFSFSYFLCPGFFPLLLTVLRLEKDL